MVRVKDGKKYYYGRTIYSRQENSYGVFKWCLDKVEDTNGNFMNIIYGQDQGEIYLDRIDYAGNGSLNPSTYVKFYLEDRPDKALKHDTNAAVTTAFRLKTIDVGVGTSRVRAYKLGYATDGSAPQSFLDEVQQFGTDAILDESGTVTDGTLYPAIAMSHQQTEDGFIQNLYSLNYPVNGGLVRAQGDFNDDGKADFIIADAFSDGRIDNPNTRTYTYLSKGDGTFTQILNPLNLDWDGGLVRAQGDFNDDGKADFIIADAFSDGRIDNPNTRTYTYLSKGDGTFAQILNPLNLDWDGGLVRVEGDFNGDGKTDFLLTNALSDGRIENPNTQTNTYISKPGIPGLLTNIANALGGNTTIAYTPSSQYQNTLLPFILQTIMSITVDDGLGTECTTNYTYCGGLYDFSTREFRGFQYVKQTNADESTVETWYHQDEYFKGRQERVELREPDSGPLLTKTLLTWDKTFLNSPTNTRAFVKLTQKRTESYDSVTVYSQENYTYDDANGNLLTTLAFGTDAETNDKKVKTVNQYYNFGTWVWRLTQTNVQNGSGVDLRKTFYGYQSGTGNLLSKEYWLNGGTNPKVEMTYDQYGNPTIVEDARDKQTETEYDATTKTYPVRVTYPTTGGVQHIVKYENYDYRFGRPTVPKDENDQPTTYGFDVFGRVTQVSYPDGGVVTKEYHDDVFPRYVVTKVKENAPGQTIDKYEYLDGLGRPIQAITFGEGGKSIVSKQFYDEMGRNDFAEGPFFSTGVGYPKSPPSQYPWVQRFFDYRGRLVEVRSPDTDYGTISSFMSYSGLSATVTDADGKSKTEKRDALGRLIEVKEHAGTLDYTTSYTYNAAGDLLGVIDSSGTTNAITYDTLGRKTGMTDPDMGTWSYTYDANGNLETQKDAKNQTITFAYDELNRVISKTYSTSDPAVTYAYDNTTSGSNGKGRPFSITKGGATTTFLEYDPMGRVKKKKKSLDGNDYVTEYAYDLSGKTTRITYPGTPAFYVDYEYYPGSGLLDTVKGSDLVQYAKFTGYDPSGKVGQVESANGTATINGYDPYSGRLLSIVTENPSGQPQNDLQRRLYTYTAAGDVESIDDQVKGITYSYGYDPLHRVLTETNNGGQPSITYQYNANGNITSRQVGSNTFTYTYHATKKHAVSNINLNGSNYAFNYDANGNMTSGYDLTDPANVASRSITWNADNLPSQIQYTKGGTTATVDFLYDGEGGRWKKARQGGETTYYVGSHYEVKGGVATLYVFAGDTRIAKITGVDKHYFHKDHLGSSTAISNASGVTVETTEFMPFGPMREHTGSTISNYKYTDQELDPETGLYFYHARYYDPVVGRFISADPIVPEYSNPQNLNRYTYCLNNPLMYRDPTGHDEDEMIYDGWRDDWHDLGYIFVPYSPPERELSYSGLSLFSVPTYSWESPASWSFDTPSSASSSQSSQSSFQQSFDSFLSELASRSILSQIMPTNSPIMTNSSFNYFVAYLEDTAGRYGETYGGRMFLHSYKDGTLTGVSVEASSWPNPNNPSPGIAPGNYAAVYNPTGHHGINPAIVLEGLGRIPTIGPNPAQNNAWFATEIEVHAGYSATNRGSAGCLTVAPNQRPQVWNILSTGQRGYVILRRGE